MPSKDVDNEPPPAPALPELGLPEECADVLARHYAEPVDDEAVLLRRLEGYLDQVHAAFHQNDYIDIDLVEKLGDMVQSLLAESPELDDDARRLVHAGARYFIDTDDAEDDMASMTGFGDDADVLVAICRHLEREDLVPKQL